MSYCRFSSDDYQCDVYVYEASDGFQTYVAARRYIFTEPLPPELPESEFNVADYVSRHQQVMRIVEKASTVKIDLPHAGGDFTDDTAHECADRLESLRALGYRVPQYAIDSLREEPVSP